VAAHLDGLFSDEPVGSERFRGGQAAADDALGGFDVTGYAARRNQVLPESSRGASRLSPYIRHGLLNLRRVWNHVEDGPARDVRKFRDELLWQEFARHWYARLGTATRHGVRRELPGDAAAPGLAGWNRRMACLDATVGELERDGWLVNQTRMWLSSDWAVRNELRWQDGENVFFTHLLDGSRAANRLGWQWTTGVGSSKHYGFSRWQVEKRAPALCRSCALEDECPIRRWPADPQFTIKANRREDVDHTGPLIRGKPSTLPDVVWLTAESLGADDPALSAQLDLPVVFCFDRELLARLRLSAKRLIFLVETLTELAALRFVEVHLGDPAEALDDRAVAVTHAPVPGFAVIAGRVDVVDTHPWPWLATPVPGSVASFSAWRRSAIVSTNPVSSTGAPVGESNASVQSATAHRSSDGSTSHRLPRPPSQP
jgi:deoxyribodipyrimidine photo-lyase